MSSTVSYGTATGPAGGVAVATTGALGPGKYTVTVTVQLSGTTAAADLNNMQLKVGSTAIGTLLTVIPTGTGTLPPNPPVVVDVPASTAVTVNAIGAATGTAVYAAQIVATVA